MKLFSTVLKNQNHIKPSLYKCIASTKVTSNNTFTSSLSPSTSSFSYLGRQSSQSLISSSLSSSSSLSYYTTDSSSSPSKNETKLASEIIKDMKSFQEYRNQTGYQPTNQEWLKLLQQRAVGGLPHHMNFEIVGIDDQGVDSQMIVRNHHLAANGYIHAGSLITLADTCCGFGCFSKLPIGSIGFTTIELKSNFFGTSNEGALIKCRATMVHSGKSTQVWNAILTDATNNKTMAMFTCTEMILYNKK
ncbi:phenylacetic acid degradation-related protein [Cavenderia fasciculata]|uniref:Phenylacetic acid degradation-related protein n=1 Tax=Cavenderia fasciculata TaxID=261658 RepID=F4Q009_CACFS|nr:phenylacetic acid degradation-related protein [Cavenderia fasciculata]EGG18923.1 phenylacetic acid degradation-related protein [Cavenderia fasciculata]|eukprot:XP_004357385.1 phenylacetic acid degradation-related protein [Cavenderia fasciculata]